MGESRIDVTLSDELLDEFRSILFNKYGPKKGALKKGLIEAINMWINYQKQNSIKIPRDPKRKDYHEVVNDAN